MTSSSRQEKATKLRLAVPTAAVRDEFRRRLGKSARDLFDIRIVRARNLLMHPLPARDRRRIDLVVLTTADFDRVIEGALDAAEDRAAAEAYARTTHEERIPSEMVDRLLAGESPIRIWREHRGMTLDQLAAATGRSKGYLSDLENGKRAGPIKTLRLIAEALKIAVDELLPGGSTD